MLADVAGWDRLVPGRGLLAPGTGLLAVGRALPEAGGGLLAPGLDRLVFLPDLSGFLLASGACLLTGSSFVTFG